MIALFDSTHWKIQLCVRWSKTSNNKKSIHSETLLCFLTCLKPKENYLKEPIKGAPLDLLALVWTGVLVKRASDDDETVTNPV